MTEQNDFFQPGHTYARKHHDATIRFLVDRISTSPDGCYRVAFGWRAEDGDSSWSPSDSDDLGGWTDVTPAASAVVAPAADRAAVLREAADELGRMDYDSDNTDYGYDTYRDAWNGGVMDGAALLRRMADEEQPATEAQLASPAVNAANALQDERRHYEIACEENARLRAAIVRVRAAIHIADDEDVTDWQRGYRACAIVATQALDEPK